MHLMYAAAATVAALLFVAALYRLAKPYYPR